MLPIPWLKLLPFAAAFGAGVVASELYHDRFADQWLREDVTRTVTEQVSRERDLACLATTEAAKAAAVEAERRRQQLAAENALDQFVRETTARDAERVNTIETLETENRRYAERLAEAGRRCPLVRDDIIWLQQDDEPAG